MLEIMRCCRLVLQGRRLLVMLGCWDPLVGIRPKHAVGVISHGHRRYPLRLPRISPSPKLQPSARRLPGQSHTAVDLVRSMALEVLLRLLWLYPTLGARFLVQPVRRDGPHHRVVLRLAPQILKPHAAWEVMAGHMRIRGRGRVGAWLAAPTCSSDAVHIHFAIQICMPNSISQKQSIKWIVHPQMKILSLIILMSFQTRKTFAHLRNTN